VPDDPKAWMKKLWSIRIEVVGGGSQQHSYVVYSTAKPFEASPEEAQQTLEDLRSKIMSICVSATDRPTPIIAYEREPHGQITMTVQAWTRDMSKYPAKAETSRHFRAVIDEVVIPADVLRRCIVRVSLLEEY
jgi:hypothetical protein